MLPFGYFWKPNWGTQLGEDLRFGVAEFMLKSWESKHCKQGQRWVFEVKNILHNSKCALRIFQCQLHETHFDKAGDFLNTKTLGKWCDFWAWNAKKLSVWTNLFGWQNLIIAESRVLMSESIGFHVVGKFNQEAQCSHAILHSRCESASFAAGSKDCTCKLLMHNACSPWPQPSERWQVQLATTPLWTT